MKRFFHNKLLLPLLSFLKQGMTPKKLAVCLAAGAVCGIFPVVGSTTLLCLVIALIFRLNVAVMQLINYFVYPFQLILIIPFLKAGATVFGVETTLKTPTEMWQMIKIKPLLALQELGYIHLLGITVWSLVSIPVFAFIFFMSRPLLQRVMENGKINAD